MAEYNPNFAAKVAGVYSECGNSGGKSIFTYIKDC